MSSSSILYGPLKAWGLFLLLLSPLSGVGQGFVDDVRSVRQRFKKSKGLSFKMTYRLIDTKKGEVEQMNGRYAKYGEDRFYRKIGTSVMVQNEELTLVIKGGFNMIILTEPKHKVGKSLFKFPLDSLENIAGRFDRLKEKEEGKGNIRVYGLDLPKGMQYRKLEFYYEPEKAFFTQLVYHLREQDDRYHPAVKEEHRTDYTRPRMVLNIKDLAYSNKDPVPRGIIMDIIKKEDGQWHLREAYKNYRLIDRTQQGHVSN